MTPPALQDPTPYDGLGPETVLDALDSVGPARRWSADQLNSFENRVFQVFLEDGRVVVAKFYRPGRWSDAQILEEHTFAIELASAEIPVAAPLPLQIDAASPLAKTLRRKALTLAEFATPTGPFRFAVTPRLGGRAPELEDDDTLEWIGRFIGRMHAVWLRAPLRAPANLSPETFGTAHRDWLLGQHIIPLEANRRGATWPIPH